MNLSDRLKARTHESNQRTMDAALAWWRTDGRWEKLIQALEARADAGFSGMTIAETDTPGRLGLPGRLELKDPPKDWQTALVSNLRTQGVEAEEIWPDVVVGW